MFVCTIRCSSVLWFSLDVDEGHGTAAVFPSISHELFAASNFVGVAMRSFPVCTAHKYVTDITLLAHRRHAARSVVVNLSKS
jgi:hypothetical protein